MTAAVRVLIAAGGTGGHIFPGLAIADALAAAGAQVAWLGAGGMETALINKRGLPLYTVPYQSPRRIWQLPLLMLAVWRALRVIKKLSPALVLCMGGYAGLPGGLAARLRRLPLVVHEQNAVPGKANRLLARFASAVLTGFPPAESAAAESARYHYVGNPVRAEFTPRTEPRASQLRRVLILGGSQGARALNEVVPAALALLQQQGAALQQIVHQCGRGNQDAVAARYQQADFAAAEGQVQVHEFINDVAGEMTAADMVICRAGASTLAELAAAGVGAVLVPYPYAAADHQRLNAEVYARRGAALLCLEQALTPQRLAAALAGVDCGQLAAAAAALAVPDAAQQAAAICLRTAEEHRQRGRYAA